MNEYTKSIYVISKVLPKRILVEFALYCADDAKKYENKLSLQLADIILQFHNMVNEWLDNKSNESDIVYLLNYSNPKIKTNTFNSIYEVLWCTQNRHRAMWAADYAAASYGNKYKYEKLKKYIKYLYKLVDEMSEVEKIIYKIDKKLHYRKDLYNEP